VNVRLDFKALGYGLATFVVGHVAMSAIGTVAVGAGDTSMGKAGWSILQLAGYLVPVIAGYAAYQASHRRVPQYPVSGIPLVIVSYGLLAALGAIVGNYRRNRVGP
jgi:hypothetical protein